MSVHIETMAQPIDTEGPLPTRRGIRPPTTSYNLHIQLGKQPEPPFSAEIVVSVRKLSGVVLAANRRVPPRTMGLFLEPAPATGHGPVPCSRVSRLASS